MNENGRWVTMNGIHVFIKDGQSPMDAFIRQKKMTHAEKINNISQKYKNDLLFPIQATKVKNYWTGDQKTGKYHWEYHAKLKNGYDIYEQSLEKIEEQINKLKKKIKKEVLWKMK